VPIAVEILSHVWAEIEYKLDMCIVTNKSTCTNSLTYNFEISLQFNVLIMLCSFKKFNFAKFLYSFKIILGKYEVIVMNYHVP
jgi:hypothetical protein